MKCRDVLVQAVWMSGFVIAVFSAGAQSLPGSLSIGDAAPLTERQLERANGGTLTLKSAAGAQGLLVIFTSNTCTWARKWEDRYAAASAAASNAGIGVIAINANAALRAGSESIEAMRARAEEKGYTFPYVVDNDATLARSFGVLRTPEVYLFDATLTLAYKGAIDDNARSVLDVEQPYLQWAISAMSGGRKIDPSETNGFGCTVKEAGSRS